MCPAKSKKIEFSVIAARIEIAGIKQDCIDEIKKLIKPYLKSVRPYKEKVARVKLTEDFAESLGDSETYDGYFVQALSEKGFYYGGVEEASKDYSDVRNVEDLLCVLQYVRKSIDQGCLSKPKTKKAN